jgi:hypothetical protein
VEGRCPEIVAPIEKMNAVDVVVENGIANLKNKKYNILSIYCELFNK